MNPSCEGVDTLARRDTTAGSQGRKSGAFRRRREPSGSDGGLGRLLAGVGTKSKIAVGILLFVYLATIMDPAAADSSYLSRALYRTPVLRQALDFAWSVGQFADGWYTVFVKFPHMPLLLQTLGTAAGGAWTAWQAGGLGACAAGLR